MTIIILEGPEAVGKSTLAKKLSSSMGLAIAHRSWPKTEEEKLGMFDMYMQALEEDDNVIYDRCWYSEMVYGPIMRDKSYITKEQMWMLERKALRKGAMVIHCTDTMKNIWQRLQQRGDDYVTDFDVLSDIRIGYETLMRRTGHHLPITRYEINKNVPLL